MLSTIWESYLQYKKALVYRILIDFFLLQTKHTQTSSKPVYAKQNTAINEKHCQERKAEVPSKPMWYICDVYIHSM